MVVNEPRNVGHTNTKILWEKKTPRMTGPAAAAVLLDCGDATTPDLGWGIGIRPAVDTLGNTVR